MLILLIGLIIVFFAARFLVLRYSGNPTLSYSVAAAMVLLFLIGVWSKGALFPDQPGATTTAAAPATPQPTAPPGEPVVPADPVLSQAQLKALRPLGPPVRYANIEGVGGGGPNGDQVPAGPPMVVHGWAGDPVTKAAAAGLVVIIDGKRRINAGKAYGADRMDVAWFYRTMKMLRTGFSVSVPTTGLAKGAHTIQLGALHPDGRDYQLIIVPPKPFTIE